MNSRRHIQGLIYFTVFVLTVILYANHEQLQGPTLRYAANTASIVLFAVFIFDAWLWRLPVWRGWLVKRPSIAGTWRVTLQSHWIDPATGKGIGPIEGFMVVRQSLSTLYMRQFTRESTSELLGTEVVCSIDGFYCVSGVYRNVPKYDFRHRSEIHHGALWLEVEDPDKKMTGHYWTDRNSAGTMVLTDRRPRKKASFDAAKIYLASPPRSWWRELLP